MRMFHVTAGLLALVSGAIALSVLKGGQLHRKSGMVFVWTMLCMSASGALMAALGPNRPTVIAGVLTFYLVGTALLTVRRPAESLAWIDTGGALLALTIGVAAMTFGLEALRSAKGSLDGIPAVVIFKFGIVALLATIGDVRMILAGGIQGARRIARHLWRMGFAMYVATASFFLGQAQVFPVALRKPLLLAIPVLLVVGLTLYWLARVRFTQQFRRPVLSLGRS